MRVVTFKADEELIAKLDTVAKLEGVTRSEIIRRAIEEYVKYKLSQYMFAKPKRVILLS